MQGTQSDLQNSFYVKNEASLNSHQSFHSRITGEDFNAQNQDTPVEVDINVGDGTFDVQLDFEEQQSHHLQEGAKESLETVKVNSQELLPVPLIEEMVSKDEVGYFTYEIANQVEESMEMEKENKPKEELLERNYDFESNSIPLEGKESIQLKEVVKEEVEKTKLQPVTKSASARAKPYKCEQCAKSFRKIENLERHSATAHRANDTSEILPAIFKCEECGQRCSTLKNLKRHQLIHGKRKYSCTVCKKCFFRPDTLKKHAERHGHSLLDNLNEPNDLFDSEGDEDMTKCTFEDEYAIGELYFFIFMEKIKSFFFSFFSLLFSLW